MTDTWIFGIGVVVIVVFPFVLGYICWHGPDEQFFESLWDKIVHELNEALSEMADAICGSLKPFVQTVGEMYSSIAVYCTESGLVPLEPGSDGSDRTLIAESAKDLAREFDSDTTWECR